MKRSFGMLCLTLAAALAVLMAGCAPQQQNVAGSSGSSGNNTAAGDSSPATEGRDSTLSPIFREEDLQAEWDDNSATHIILNGDSVSIEGAGAAANGTVVTISAAGTYVLSGSLADGQIRVDATKDDLVRLVLNGAAIHCSNSAPIYSLQADKTIVTLAAGSENILSDGETYQYDDVENEEPNATLFCKDDLTINGTGALTVNASFRNGIGTKDHLIITGGSLNIEAANDGLRGRDAICILDGSFLIQAGADGMQSNNDEDPTKGWILLQGGNYEISAQNDGIQAETALEITGGSYTLQTGGGSANASTGASGGARQEWGRMPQAPQGEPGTPTETPSAKALKAGTSLTVRGGDFTIDSSDDALHTNGDLLVSGGSLLIDSGDDGLHADNALTVSGGSLQINRCYEGVEGLNVRITGGEIRLTSSDDGLNAAGGNDASALGGRPGQNAFASTEGALIDISGGTLVINAQGDGIDSNGDLTISGGTVLVAGPENSGNGALDYNGNCHISGGVLIAAGSSGMSQAPGSGSAQNSLMVTYTTRQEAGTLLCLTDEQDHVIAAFAPPKAYQSVVISTPQLQQGSSYRLYTGGQIDGSTAVDGWYESGSYTPGELLTEVTLSGSVTSITDTGEARASGGMGGMGGGRGGPKAPGEGGTPHPNSREPGTPPDGMTPPDGGTFPGRMKGAASAPAV